MVVRRQRVKEAVLTAEVRTSNEMGRSCDRTRRWSPATVRIFTYHRLRDEEGLTVWAVGFFDSPLRHLVLLYKMGDHITAYFNPLKPNDAYTGRTALLTSKIAFYIFIQPI